MSRPEAGLPWTLAHLERAVVGRTARPFVPQLGLFAQAAVLVPVQARPEGLYVLLTRRPETMRSHPGQISFPGGRVDDTDISRTATALREAFEEVGLRPDEVRVLGELDEAPTLSWFVIRPVVALVPYPARLTVSQREVEEVLELPLSAFWADRGSLPPRRLEALGYRGGTRGVWGATSRILGQLVSLLAEAASRPGLV